MFEGLTDLSITTKELKSFHQNIASVATHKLKDFLGIQIDTLSPKVDIRYDKGKHVAKHEKRDGEDFILLWPLKRHEREGTFEIPARFTIHEAVHALENRFLELPEKRDFKTAIYLSEGFAHYLSHDDPAGIHEALGDDKPMDSYSWIKHPFKKGVKDDPHFRETIRSYLSLDKLYVTPQLNLENADIDSKDFPKDLEAKLLVPYRIGNALVRYIVERPDGGLKALKYIMSKVQVNKKYALGWEDAKDGNSNHFVLEEVRVRKLLKEAIRDKFGDVEEFEKDWKKTVLGESIETETEQNPQLKFQLDDDLEIKKITECLSQDDKPGGMDMKGRIIESHPKLAGLLSLQPAEIKDRVGAYVLEDYSQNAAKYQENAASMEKEWEGYAGEFYEAIRKIFPNTKWPKGKYVGYLSISPPFPRYIEDKTFQLPANLDGEWLQITAHEMAHFIFYEYVRQRYFPSIENTVEMEMNRLMEGKLKVPLWELSEVFNMIVLSHEGFGKGRTNFQTRYSDLIPLRDELGALWRESNEDIDEFFSRLEMSGLKE